MAGGVAGCYPEGASKLKFAKVFMDIVGCESTTTIS